MNTPYWAHQPFSEEKSLAALLYLQLFLLVDGACDKKNTIIMKMMMRW